MMEPSFPLAASTKPNIPEHLNWKSRPARKQLEQSLATIHAYRQGDEEYNIWYDKFLTEVRQEEKIKERAKTRCFPEFDVGYTSADMVEKREGYFCIYFAKGCCCEGEKCRQSHNLSQSYYHHIPTKAECLRIDNARDIFGRMRFADHREDRADYKAPTGPEPAKQLEDIIWRHFHVWGDLEEVQVDDLRSICYVRYQHREAMFFQQLDKGEILDIRWAPDETNLKDPEQGKERVQNEAKTLLEQARERLVQEAAQLARKKEVQASRLRQQQREKHLRQLQRASERKDKKIKKQAEYNIAKMASILDQIEAGKDEAE